jgi:hypothetical protein
MSFGDELIEYQKKIFYSDEAIETALMQYKDPIQELFGRYCRGSEEEKNCMVLALIGRIMVERARKTG